MFSQNPFIIGESKPGFSAWNYAKTRVAELFCKT